ncbi:MAG: NAD-binding protein [Thermodesulfobacteriota bacterium]|nr:NAD-binding protein [Thermodesulfobacteriota bacterium]
MNSYADIWVIGSGRFGRRAVEVLSRTRPKARLLAVDHDDEALKDLEPFGAEIINGDGLDFLVKNLFKESGPEWVMPCVPFHLAYRWLLARLGPKAESIPVPPEFGAGLPHPLQADQGGFYISYADFLCPIDCPEPADICTYTGKPRVGTLFKDLAAKSCPGFEILVLRSRQLAPGLGGYRRSEMFDLERRVLESGGRLLVATACRCHGVIHGLRIHSSPG